MLSKRELHRAALTRRLTSDTNESTTATPRWLTRDPCLTNAGSPHLSVGLASIIEKSLKYHAS